jgi:hypothetical protein
LQQTQQTRQNHPVSYAFSYLNSPKTAIQYRSSLKRFFDDFLGFQGDLEKQGLTFIEQVKSNGPAWAQEQIMLYLNMQKNRINKQNTPDERKSGDITAGTLKNYISAIKCFYEYNGGGDLPSINWKWISRVLPKARRASNDRSPITVGLRKVGSVGETIFSLYDGMQGLRNLAVGANQMSLRSLFRP